MKKITKEKLETGQELLTEQELEEIKKIWEEILKIRKEKKQKEQEIKEHIDTHGENKQNKEYITLIKELKEIKKNCEKANEKLFTFCKGKSKKGDIEEIARMFELVGINLTNESGIRGELNKLKEEKQNLPENKITKDKNLIVVDDDKQDKTIQQQNKDEVVANKPNEPTIKSEIIKPFEKREISEKDFKNVLNEIFDEYQKFKGEDLSLRIELLDSFHDNFGKEVSWSKPAEEKIRKGVEEDIENKKEELVSFKEQVKKIIEEAVEKEKRKEERHPIPFEINQERIFELKKEIKKIEQKIQNIGGYYNYNYEEKIEAKKELNKILFEKNQELKLLQNPSKTNPREKELTEEKAAQPIQTQPQISIETETEDETKEQRKIAEKFLEKEMLEINTNNINRKIQEIKAQIEKRIKYWRNNGLGLNQIEALTFLEDDLIGKEAKTRAIKTINEEIINEEIKLEQLRKQLENYKK